MQLSSTNFANTSLMSYSNSSEIGMVGVTYNPSNWNDLAQNVTNSLSQAFNFVDKALSLPILGANAEPLTIHSTLSNSRDRVRRPDGDAFLHGSYGFSEFKKRQQKTSQATKSLIEICQNNAGDCSQDSKTRQTAMEKLAKILEKKLPKSAADKNSKILDCFIPGKCNSIGCRDSDLIEVKEEIECRDKWVATISLVSCPGAYVPIPLCLYKNGQWVEKCHQREDESFKYCQIHPREKEAAQLLHSRESLSNWAKSFFVPPEWKDYFEFLRFRADDPREKTLVLAAESDHNGFLKPRNIAGILSQLSQKYDLSYKVVKTVDDIREAIASAAKTGKLANVIINGHGNPWGIHLNGTNSWDNFIHANTPDLASIFSAVQPYGKILLIGCSVGASKDENGDPIISNFAETLAKTAKRTVLAPTNTVYGGLTQLLSKDTSALYHPAGIWYSYVPFYNSNIFKTFKSEFKNCSSVPIDSIHPRDFRANEEIKKDLDGKALLSDSEKAEGTNYLRFCKDDPKHKFLFLSAKFDNENPQFFDPINSLNILGPLADNYDLKYKVVSSLKKICEEIEDASTYGKVAGVIIQATGRPSDGLYLSENEKLTANNSFANCFSKLQSDVPIVFLGGSVGQNANNPNNLAQKISKETQKPVIAPTCLVSPPQVVIQSLNPLLISHPKWSFLRNYFTIGCPENNENTFKTFDPKA